MKYLESYKLFESNLIDFSEVKEDIEEILIELNDIGLDTSVYCYDSSKYKDHTKYKKEWHSQIDFIEIQLSSKNDNIMTDKNYNIIKDVEKRIGKYLSVKVGNPNLDIESPKINNLYFYSDWVFNLDYELAKYTYYFGFTLESQYRFWYHEFAKNIRNHHPCIVAH